MQDNKPVEARIVASYGNNHLLNYDNKNIKCINKKNNLRPVAGDIVTFTMLDNETALIKEILPRKNQIKKLSKTIATNIDQIFLVIAPEPKYSLNIIDKYLIMATNDKLPIKIIINKIDLIKKTDLLYKDLKVYKDIGYEVNALSVKEKTNLENFKKTLTNKQNIFVGQSGVGKSSLIKEIVIDDTIKIASIGEKSNLGKHTTSVTFVYEIKNGGYLIDSPGIRELQLNSFSKKEISQGFIEFNECKHLCKFRNCTHINEINCEVKNRVKKNLISQTRYENYLQLIKEVD